MGSQHDRWTLDLGRISRALLCGPGMVIAWDGYMLPRIHTPSIGEVMPLAVTAMAFVAVSIWMFRRFGVSEGQAALGQSAELDAETVEEFLAATAPSAHDRAPDQDEDADARIPINA